MFFIAQTIHGISPNQNDAFIICRFYIVEFNFDCHFCGEVISLKCYFLTSPQMGDIFHIITMFWVVFVKSPKFSLIKVFFNEYANFSFFICHNYHIIYKNKERIMTEKKGKIGV